MAADGTAGFSRIIVAGVSGGVDDGVITVNSGGSFALDGDALVEGNDYLGSPGSTLSLTGNGPDQNIDFNGDGLGAFDVPGPVLQLDADVGGVAENVVRTGTLDQQDGTVWADSIVSILGVGSASVVEADARLYGAYLQVSSVTTSFTVNDSAQVIMAGESYDNSTQNQFNSQVLFDDTSQFTTTQDVFVGAAGLMTFRGTDFTMDDASSDDLVLSIAPDSAASFEGGVANVDGRLHVSPGTAGPVQPATLAVTNYSSLTVTRHDHSDYFFGGVIEVGSNVDLNDTAQLNMPSFILKSDTDPDTNPTDRAQINIRAKATFNVDYPEGTLPANRCLQAGYGPSGVGPSFTRLQHCSRLLGNSRIDIFDEGTFDTDNRIIVFSDSSFTPNGQWDANPSTRLGIHVSDDGNLISRWHPEGNKQHGLVIRQNAVLVATGNATIDAGVIRLRDSDGSADWAGTLVLADFASLEVDYLDLDIKSRMLYYGNSAHTTIRNDTYPALHDLLVYEFDHPAGAVVAAPADGLYSAALPGPGTPATACGGGGGGQAAPGGGGQDNSNDPSGLGGICAGCDTFTIHATSGDTIFAPPNASSRGGDGGAGIYGGYAAGRIYFDAEDGTLLHLFGDMYASGGDAADNNCAGGGASGGSIYINGHDLDIGASLTVSADGGDGGRNAADTQWRGGGGAGGTIQFLYRSSIQPGDSEDFRRVYSRGGSGYEDGTHGTAVLAEWDDDLGRIERVDSTYLVFKSAASNSYTFFSDWNQLNPIEPEIRGEVTEFGNTLLTVNGNIDMEDTDWRQRSAALDIVMLGAGSIDMNDSTFTALDSAPDNAISFTSSGESNLLYDGSTVEIPNIDVIGASGKWHIFGTSAGNRSGMTGTNVTFTNIIDLTLGSWAYLEGNVSVTATGTIHLDRDIDPAGATFVSADSIACSGAEPGGNAAGGGHGGAGGDGFGLGGDYYDNAILPSQGGSEGGDGDGTGGCGGGTIMLSAPTCTIDALMTANGDDGVVHGGGGSGGSIVLNCPTLSFTDPATSVLTAVGGDGVGTDSGGVGAGGGGGGIVSIVTDTVIVDAECDVDGGIGTEEEGSVGNCSQRYGTAVPYSLRVADGFRMQENDRINLGAGAPPAVVLLDTFLAESGTEVTRNFNDDSSETGSIDVDTDFTLMTLSSWDPWATTDLTVHQTLDWQEDSKVGNQTSPPNMALNLGTQANFRNQAELGDVTVRAIPGRAPTVEFGVSGPGALGPWGASRTDVYLTNGAALTGNITHFDPYQIVATGRGGLGGVAEDESGQGPGGGAYGRNAGGAGGGSGGRGAQPQVIVGGTPAPGLYAGTSRAGTYLDPNTVGGGGGVGFISAPGLSAGGNGGGQVRFGATLVQALGPINADGGAGLPSGDGETGGGGGGGGQIAIHTVGLTTNPATTFFFARGGASGIGTRASGGAGGGGRVMITLEGGSAAAAEALADSLQATMGRVEAGLNWDTDRGAEVGTMGVLWVGPPSQDQLFAVTGWRHDDFQSVLLDRFDATRSVFVHDLGLAAAVTISAGTELELDGVEWGADDDVTLITPSLLFDNVVFKMLGVLSLQVDTPTTVNGSEVHTTDLNIDGNSANWTWNNSIFDATSLVQLSEITNFAMTSSVLKGNVVANIDGDMGVDEFSVINANGLGFAPQQGPGAGSDGIAANESGGGGGNGGFGGQGTPGGVQGALGGSPIGSSLQPTIGFGSGGGDGVDSDADGGYGGGFVNLNVAGTLTLDGLIQANGGESEADGTTSGGGGAGGAVAIVANVAAVLGTIEAEGGRAAPAANRGGGGSGGRILVQAGGFIPLPDKMDVRAGDGNGLPAADEPQAGTAGIHDLTNNTLTAVGGWRWETVDLVRYPALLAFDAIPSAVAGVGDGVIRQPNQDISLSVGGPVTIDPGMMQDTGGNNFTLTAGALILNDAVAVTAASIVTNGGHYTIAGTSDVILEGDSSIKTIQSGVGTAGTLTIVGAGDLTMNSSSNITGNLLFRGQNFFSSLTSTIDAANFGSLEGVGAGTPAAAAVSTGGSGAGYGGTGGNGAPIGSGGIAFGDQNAPTDYGSGGGLAYDATGLVPGSAGAGGGVVRIIATGDATVRGVIDVNGEQGSIISSVSCGGGGAGGSIFVSSGGTMDISAGPPLFGPISMFANGGAGQNCPIWDGGGGAGGRVAFCSVAGGVNDSLVQVSGGAGGGSATSGQPGTVVSNCVPVTPSAAVLVATNAVHMGDIDFPQTIDDAPVIAFSISELTGLDGAVMETIVFKGSGTINEATQLSDVSIVVDENFNGIRDAGDTVIDSGQTFSGDDGTVSFDLTSLPDPLPTIAAGDDVNLLVTVDLTSVPTALTVEIALISNSDVIFTGESSGNPGLASGAPMLSGTKTVSASPRPAVSSFTPDEGSNAAAIPIEIYGLNFKISIIEADRVQFDSVPPNTFVIDTVHDASWITAEITPGATQPGYYNVRVRVPGFGENVTSAALFRLYEPCNIPTENGICADGQQVGNLCEQVTQPGDFPEVCGNDIDEDCDGAAQDCNDDDDDGDGYSPNQGDCDDTDSDNTPDASAGTPLAGLVCITTDEFIPVSALSGVPQDLSTYAMAFDTASTIWRTDGSASWYRSAGDSLLGSALLLGGLDEEIQVPYHPDLFPGPKMSVSGWIRFDAPPTQAVVVAAGNLTPYQPVMALTYDSATGFNFGLGTDDGSYHQITVPASAVTGHWYQLVGSFDTDSGDMIFYLDGVEVGRDNLGLGLQLLTAAIVPIHVGSHPDLSPVTAYGAIDEVRVFGRILSDAEIVADYQAVRLHEPSTLSTAQERMHLTFNSGFDDSSGNQHNGAPQAAERISGRTHQAEFASVAYVVATDGGIDIYHPVANGTHELFMRIPLTPVAGQGALDGTSVDFAEMFNGVLVAGTSAGLTVFDFVSDSIYRINATGVETYDFGFDTLLGGAWTAVGGDTRSLPAATITGLAIGANSADDGLIAAVGQDGFITAIELQAGGLSASRALAAGFEASGLTFGELGTDTLYYGNSDGIAPADYRVVTGLTAWIAGGGGSDGVTAIDLPNSATRINDATFGLANSTGDWRLGVAHNGGLTYGVPVGDLIGAGQQDDQMDPVVLCPSNDVRSIHYDFDSRYSACSGAGISSWDDGAELMAEFIDDTVATNDMGQLQSLDIVGVGGHTEICAATALGLECFYRPLRLNTCDTLEQGVCGVAGGGAYPLSGPPLSDAVCIQEVFPTKEFCGDGIDSDCQGDLDPVPDSVCDAGVPFVDLGPDILIQIPDCAPQTVTLPTPTIVDDLDTVLDVSIATNIDPLVATIDGVLSEWDAGNELGSSASSSYHFEAGYDTMAFAAVGQDYNGSADLRIAFGQRPDGLGCNLVVNNDVPDPNGDVTIINPTVKALFLVEVNDSGSYGVRECTNPGGADADSQWGGLQSGPISEINVVAGGTEFTIDMTHPLFDETDLSIQNNTDYVAFWSWDNSAGGEVAETFPTNPEGPAGQVLSSWHELVRTVPANNVFPLGQFSYGVWVTDSDGNSAFDDILIEVEKTTSPALGAFTGVDAPSTGPLTVMDWRCQSGDARLHDDCGAGEAPWTDDQIAPLAHPNNCAGPLIISEPQTQTVPPIRDPVVYPPGISLETIRVTDSTGAFTERVITIEVTDGEPPVLVWNNPPVEFYGGVYYHYLPNGGPRFTTVDLDALYTVTDNSDPPLPAPTIATCVNDMPVGGINPVVGNFVDVIVTCSDTVIPVPNSADFPIRVVRMLPDPITMAFLLEEIGNPTPLDGPDANDDPDLWFGTFPDLRASSIEVTVSGDCLVPGSPITEVSSDWAGDPSLPPVSLVDIGGGQWEFTEPRESIHQVTVRGWSLCDPASLSQTEFDIAVDTIDPTIDAGFNNIFGAPLAARDLNDTSTYEGVFAADPSAHATMAGTVGDSGCGIESITVDAYEVAIDGTEFERRVAGPDTYTTTVVDHTLTLINGPFGPPVGPISSSNPPTTGDWSGGGGDISIPATANVGGYELILTVTDCAGHSVQRSFHIFHLDLDAAIGRTLAAIERFEVTLPAIGDYEDDIEPRLLQSRRALRHSRGALRQTDDLFVDPDDHPWFATTLRGIQAATDQLSLVLAVVDANLGDADLDHIEIRRKAHEIAIGTRLWNQAWRQHLADEALIVELDSETAAIASLANSLTFHDERMADNGPAASSLNATRWAAYYTDLAQNPEWTNTLAAIDANPANPNFFAAIALITDIRERADEYLNAIDDDETLIGSRVMLGDVSMTAIQTKLDRIGIVFDCYAAWVLSRPAPLACNNMFGVDLDTNVPTSRDLTKNILDLLTIQQEYFDISEGFHVDVDNMSFLTAVVGSVAFANGVTNSADNICGREDHPLIGNGAAERSDVETLREDIGPGQTTIETFTTGMSAEDPICAAVYAYNAAYVLDTRFPYINLTRYELTVIDENSYGGEFSFCFPDDPDHDCDADVPINCSLSESRRLLFNQQDIYDDYTCACVGANRPLNIFWCVDIEDP